MLGLSLRQQPGDFSFRPDPGSATTTSRSSSWATTVESLTGRDRPCC